MTHGHGDHLGDAVALGSRLRPAWPAIHELSLWLGRQVAGGADSITGMNKGGTVEAAGLKVTMTRAEHSAGDWNADGGVPLYLGEPAGFVVELENGFRIYHAGDTDVFGDMALIRDLHKPDLAMLPIGGHYTMGPRQAALAVELLGVQHVMPIHYGTFPALSRHADRAADGPRRARPRLGHGLRSGPGRDDHLVRPERSLALVLGARCSRSVSALCLGALPRRSVSALRLGAPSRRSASAASAPARRSAIALGAGFDKFAL